MAYTKSWDQSALFSAERAGCHARPLRASPRAWPDAVLVGEKQTSPGVGEEALVPLRGPAALADQELVELGGVGSPDDVGGLVRVQAQRGDGGQVRNEQAHIRCAAFGDLGPQGGQFRFVRGGLLDDA